LSTEWMDLGRTVVANGDLKKLRKRLGLNRSSMADLLSTSFITYKAWEENRDVKLWPTTAMRIGRFYRLAHTHLELLEEEGINLKRLLPLHHATIALGMPQELVLKRYREGRIDAEDLGILGLWLYKEDLERIRDKSC